MSSCFFCFFGCSFHIQTHKPDQTKININGFNMTKSAAQLLYGPVLIYWNRHYLSFIVQQPAIDVKVFCLSGMVGRGSSWWRGESMVPGSGLPDISVVKVMRDRPLPPLSTASPTSCSSVCFTLSMSLVSPASTLNISAICCCCSATKFSFCSLVFKSRRLVSKELEAIETFSS